MQAVIPNYCCFHPSSPNDQEKVQPDFSTRLELLMACDPKFFSSDAAGKRKARHFAVYEDAFQCDCVCSIDGQHSGWSS